MSLKVSIVTAVRNGARDITVTLASIESQDYPNIEHVVVDGASTDGTADVVRRDGRRVAKLLSEPDRGVYDAFNKGLALATGDVVGYLNAGDVYEDAGVISRIAARFEREPVECGLRRRGDHRAGAVAQGAASLPVRLVRGVAARLGFHAGAPDAVHPARGVRARRAITTPSYRIAGDFELCVRLFAEQGIRAAYLPEVLVRMPRGGLSNSGWRSKWVITQEMHRACRAHGISTSYAKLFARFPVKALEVLRRGG